MIAALGLIVAIWASLWQWRRREYIDQRWWYPSWLLPVAGLAIAIHQCPTWLLIQKTLGYLVMPVGVIWVALIVLTAVAWRRDRRWFWPLVGLFLAYTLAGNVWVGGALVRVLERPYRGQDPLAQGPFDAVFVLGGGTEAGPGTRVQLGDAADRMLLAADLHRAGRTRYLVASGQVPEGLDAPHDHARATADFWVRLGIPTEDIILVTSAACNTRQETREYAHLLADQGWERIGLVTSAWHLPRAMARASDRGLAPTPLATDFRGTVPPASLPNLVPQTDGFCDVHTACWEIIGRLAGF